MNERQYSRHLVETLHSLFPECFIIKNDPRQRQGLPDILVLWNKKWAMLEIKINGKANVQPNQDFYVDLFNEMSFASFINPENEEEVLGDLQLAFGSSR